MPVSSPLSQPSASTRRATLGRPAVVLVAGFALLFGLSSVAIASPAVPSSGPAGSLNEVAACPDDLPYYTLDGWEAGTCNYIVLLDEPALALYTGGIEGLEAPTRTETGRLDVDGTASAAYRAFLRTRQDAVLNAMGIDPASVHERNRLDVALNGFIVPLTHEEAVAASQIPGVRGVEVDQLMEPHTDVGPEWIDAPTIWGFDSPEDLKANARSGCAVLNGPVNGATTSCGEGIVVGIIDTGVNTDHPSFADVGGDSYDHTNPRAGADPRPDFYGECDETTGAPFCNDKLIGVYDMTEAGLLPLTNNPEDDHGHGSHTASTTAGNVLDASIVSPTLELTRTISGVAPHANIISYKGCQTTAPASCQLTLGVVISALVRSIDQAVEDEVDVINFSIGGGPSDPYDQPTDPAIPSISLAFLGANAAGVLASVSAGNSGPGPGTVGRPANSPWVMTVGASTHNREFTNGVVDMAGGTNPPADLFGKSFSCGYPQTDVAADYSDCGASNSLPDGTASIVWAGDYEIDPAGTEGDCGAGPPLGAGLESSLDPFPATVDFNGAIVVCIRGTYARVDKAVQVAENGAGGFVLINDEASGDSTVADPYVIPGVHLTYEDGQLLFNWLESEDDPGSPVPPDYVLQAAIQGTFADEDPANGDVMAGFSSRGPNAPVPDVIKPDITAPGVDVFAAWRGDLPDEATDSTAQRAYNIISGTSMSAPHNAGAAALIRALHPEWTPDEVRSAIMLTSFNYLPSDGVHGMEEHDVQKEDGETSGDPFDFGAGRVDLSRAGNSGLILNETLENYVASDPDDGGEPSTLNLPSMADNECITTCSWARTLEGTAAGRVEWTVTTIAPEGISLTVEPTSFTVADGETVMLTITANVSTATLEEWHFGQVVLSPGDVELLDDDGPLSVNAVDPRTVSALHMPVAIFATEGGAQEPTPTPTPTPTVTPTPAPTATPAPGTATPAPGTATPTPTPRVRFIPDTGLDWMGTPTGVATAISLVILIGSVAMLVSPRVTAWRRSRR